MSSEDQRELDDRVNEAESKAASLRKKNRELARANAELERRLSAQTPSPPDAAPETAPAAAEELHTGLNWSSFASHIADNMDLLRRMSAGEPLDEAENGRWLALDGELLKLSAEAKNLADEPFFEPEIFGDLTQALFSQSLALDASQLERLRELNEVVMSRVPRDIGTYSSLEKYKVRRQVLAELWDGMDDVLDEEQHEDWPAVREFSEEVFHYGGQFEIGIDVKLENFINNLMINLLSETPPRSLLDNLKPLASEYLSRGRGVLGRFAQTEEELASLPDEERRRMDEEFLGLYEDFYRAMQPLLSDEQRIDVFKRRPLNLAFTFGENLTIHGRRTYFP